MTKQKTRKSALKRVKLTKYGKIRVYPAKKGHLRVEKSAKKRRGLKKPQILTGQAAKNLKLIIGG